MKIQLNTTDAPFQTPALIVLLYKDDKPGLAKRPELKYLQKHISPRIKSGDFEAKYLNTLTLFPQDEAMERIILVGLGQAQKCGPERLRNAAAQGVRLAQEMGAGSAALSLPPACQDMPGESICQVCSLGACLGGYDYVELKSDKGKSGKLTRVTLLSPGWDGSAAGLKKAIKRGQVIAEATSFARDLGNMPGNLLYPESMAQKAQDMAEQAGISVNIMGEDEARKKGMGAFLAVGQGSQRPNRMIILEYKGGPAKQKPVVLVGKAITFDSGGISLKDKQGMGTMKGDMCGGAAVLGALKAAAGLKLKLNLVGIVAAAENMPSGSAYRPGDVITSYCGKTIEIISTDAEGRMVLADALSLAAEYKPKAIVDLATLTGAAIVALGKKCAAAMGNDPALIQALQKASADTGEMIWELPLIDEYNELITSSVADMKNSGGRWGGSIIGGLFLQNFAPSKVPWVHLDIAGPADIDTGYPNSEGASGFGVQLLLSWLGA